jgi:hypothetical protein
MFSGRLRTVPSEMPSWRAIWLLVCPAASRRSSFCLVPLPARYVSGYLLGQGGTHAWVEALIAGYSRLILGYQVAPI